MPHVPAKSSRLLVVDASVFLGSGESHCRICLETILIVCHHVILTEAIELEWHNPPARLVHPYRQRFALNWRRAMSARKKIHRTTVAENVELRGKIARATAEIDDRTAMLEDVHLIEAAIAADNTILSCDKTARELFDKAAVRLGELRLIVWANPCKDEDQCIAWLEQGAEPEKHRRLGFRPDQP